MSNSKDHTVCPYCEVSLEGWEEGDDVVHEHKRRNPECEYFTLLKSIEKVESIVSRKKRAHAEAQARKEPKEPVKKAKVTRGSKKTTVDIVDEELWPDSVSDQVVEKVAVKKGGRRGKKAAVEPVEVEVEVEKIVEPEVETKKTGRTAKKEPVIVAYSDSEDSATEPEEEQAPVVTSKKSTKKKVTEKTKEVEPIEDFEFHEEQVASVGRKKAVKPAPKKVEKVEKVVAVVEERPKRGRKPAAKKDASPEITEDSESVSVDVAESVNDEETVESEVLDVPKAKRGRTKKVNVVAQKPVKKGKRIQTLVSDDEQVVQVAKTDRLRNVKREKMQDRLSMVVIEVPSLSEATKKGKVAKKRGRVAKKVVVEIDTEKAEESDATVDTVQVDEHDQESVEEHVQPKTLFDEMVYNSVIPSKSLQELYDANKHLTVKEFLELVAKTAIQRLDAVLEAQIQKLIE